MDWTRAANGSPPSTFSRQGPTRRMTRARTGSARRRWAAARRRSGASGARVTVLVSSMSALEDRVRALPKVELHQHVDGSIPAEVTWDLMRHYRLNPVPTLE